MGVLFRVLKLVPFRDRNLWVFGCWMGKKYDDNAKFLFEYVNKNHSNVRCVWLTRNKNVVALVRQLGYEAYLSSSLKGVMVSLRWVWMILVRFLWWVAQKSLRFGMVLADSRKSTMKIIPASS